MAYSFQELIRHMLAASGKSAAQVSRELGNDSNHLSVILSSGRTPRADLLAKIADACGYELILHERQDYESWELYVSDGKLVANKEHGPEDIEALSQMDADARQALMDKGRGELIDSLIAYLEGLKEQQQ